MSPVHVRLTMIFATLLQGADALTKVKIGFIGPPERIPYAKLILRQAEKQLKLDEVVSSDLRFEYVFAQGCDVKVDVLLKVKDLFEIDQVDVLIGPECTVGMNIAGLVANAFQRPIFGYGSISDLFSDKDTFATLVRTSRSMSSLGSGVNQMLSYFGWNDVAIIRNSSADCDIALSGILSEIGNKTSAFNVRAVIAIEKESEINGALKTVKSVARIIIVCFGWDPSSANTFLLNANEAKMNLADYVYIVPYYLKLSTSVPSPWQDPSLNAVDLDSLQRIYQNVLVIQTTGDDANTQSEFRSYMKANNVTLDWANLTNVETILPVIFDTLYLYGTALNHTVSHGGNISNGTEIREACQFLNFTGKSGKIVMNKLADRICEYTVLSMNASNYFTPLLSIPAVIVRRNDTVTVNRSVIPLRAETFLTVDGAHPDDTPLCGFTMDTCLQSNGKNIAVGACAAFAVTLLALMGLVCYRKRKFEQSLIKMTWKLAMKDVKLLSTQTKPCSIRELQHDNINQFLGAVIDDGPYIVSCWKYAAKGSLLDVLLKEDIHLDDTFVASILKDIVLGLEYIHKSSIHYHGTLTVMNCVVDSRWIVKLTDFALMQFLEHLEASEVLVLEESLTPQQRYHLAPEVLRKSVDPKMPHYFGAMRAADVYSLAIVVYHVIYRSEPVYDDMLSSDEIIRRIQKTGVDPLRPHLLDGQNAHPKLVALMHRCWQEDPRRRPTIFELKASLTHVFGDIMKRSLLDHMMSVLEKYATNLEKIVEERTQQLEAERRRADQLLYQMLPKSVADLLKSGLSVEPESYECVTVYFSDIVGFTTLSSESTPMEVVTMLNKLYSAFDETLLMFDVYKVETIGDAYMVVSGLPHRNGNRHVIEICDTSLSIRNVVSNFQIPHRPDRRIRIRIGIHSGPVAAGVVGQTMPRFCLFGDTVNTASRMESNSEPSKIHISESTASFLRTWPEYVIQLRGNVSLKGKGVVTTYWLLEKRESIPGEILNA